MVAIILPALLFFLISLIYRLFPPKEINHIIGYRTYRSMLNQQNWQTANRYAANRLLFTATTGLAVAIFGYQFGGRISVVLLSIGIIMAGIIISLWLTERYLKKQMQNE